MANRTVSDARVQQWYVTGLLSQDVALHLPCSVKKQCDNCTLLQV